MEGIIYTHTRVGNTITVTATPAQWYTFPADAINTWTLELPATGDVEEKPAGDIEGILPAEPTETPDEHTPPTPDRLEVADEGTLAKTGTSLNGAFAGTVLVLA